MPRGTKTFLGLDLETSGTELLGGAVPIQLGMALVDEDGVRSFNSLIGQWNWTNRGPEDGQSVTSKRPAHWDYYAATVHDLAPEDLRYAPACDSVQVNAVRWLNEQDAPEPPNLHIVGWNVAGFDLPFVREYMPLLGSRLSYRTVDLNAITFSLVGAQYNGRVLHYNEIKNMAKNHARDELALLGFDQNWHDAEYDAIAAVLSYNYLKHLVRSCN